MRTGIAAVSGFLVGFVLCWFLLARSPDADGQTGVATSITEEPTAGVSRPESVGEHRFAQAAPSASQSQDIEQPTAAQSDEADRVRSREESDDTDEAGAKQLRNRIVELEALLEEKEAALGRAGGVPIPFPEGLDDRHSQRGLLDVYSEIFESTGVQGDLVAIDCSEYPCMVQGRLDVEEDWEDSWDAIREAMRDKSDGAWFSCSSSLGRPSDDGPLTFVVAHCGPEQIEPDGQDRVEARVREFARTW